MKKYCIYPGCCNLVSNGYCEKHSQRIHPCAYPRCASNAIEGSNYCEEHQPKRLSDRRRGSSRTRGYDTRWEKVRRDYLSSHPLCERCAREGFTTPAVLVHHRIRIADGGEVYNPNNLMSLCYRCHEKIHMEQGDYKGNTPYTGRPVKPIEDVYSF